MVENISNEKHICDYGCGQEAHYQFKSGKWCCSKSQNSCPSKKERCRIAATGVKHKLALPIETNKICSFGCGQRAKFKYKSGAYCCSDDWHRCPAKHEELSQRSTKIWSDLDLRKRLSKNQRRDLFAVAIPVLENDKKCFYCGEKANFWFKTNDKYCCADRIERCPSMRKEISIRSKKLWKDENFRKKVMESQDYKDPERRKKIGEANKKWAKNNPEKCKERAIKSAKTKGPWTEEEREKFRKRLLGKTRIELYGKEKAEKIRFAIYVKVVGRKRKFPMSAETRKKMSNAKKEHWKDPNSSYNSKQFRDKKSEESKKCWMDPEYSKKIQKGLHNSPNKLESLLIKIFKDLNLNYEFVGDWSLNIGGRNPDFVNYESKKLIEHFGVYYHDTIVKLSREKHEKERIEHFKKYGYKTLIIWENEWQNIEKMKKKILKFNLDKI